MTSESLYRVRLYAIRIGALRSPSLQNGLSCRCVLSSVLFSSSRSDQVYRWGLIKGAGSGLSIHPSIHLSIYLSDSIYLCNDCDVQRL